ncbi:phosphoenolpyruvate--protein phosphotransferase [Amycolatopsis suaedae]|uniref:Phosphoenolpyruvate-protein phosphotransferase n=1 Tax=Amycolatopsis suaedae TaxID=2510978 RepID=A0A4Q7IZI0_9PSEU|nr:phosphoenolpyruvate--protein phosphotransferase [Amycolatopsis suaedae]RZQ59899.1 phosphoenolpyruvate--protein phosphotransferase [Amycolatopsis suaedae]
MSGELRGSPASPGAAGAVMARMRPAPVLPESWPAPADPDGEKSAAKAALEEVAADLERRGESVTGEAAEILSTQVMMVRDPTLAQGIDDAVDGGRPAAWAVEQAFSGHLAALRAAGGYLAERATDLADLRDRAIAGLLGEQPPGIPDPGEPFVLIAVDLAPADTVTLDPAKVRAIVTEKGGQTSHTAILARSLGIPAVVGCAGALEVADGTVVIVDGDAGTVVLDPGQDLLDAVEGKARERRERLARYSGPGSTSDGHPVALLLNVGGGPAEAGDSEGVGLFRTEFLFLDREQAPSVAEQRTAYGEVFAAFPGRPVVIRTLDAGADKPVPFANADDEPNPALGVRGQRIARRHPELLAAQLEAIALAAGDHDAEVKVMAPMIATPAEAADFAARVRAHGLAAGVMIEVPAAAIRAEAILAEVDFVSIGTNDLAQYTFAADRMLGELGDLLDSWQPALLDLVASVAEAGRRAGKPVGICGEAAADPGLAPVFAGLGVTSLSMSAPAVPEVRAALRERTFDECTAVAKAVRAAADATEARRAATS